MATNMSDAAANPLSATAPKVPDITVDAREVFGVDIDMKVPAFSVAEPKAINVRPVKIRIDLAQARSKDGRLLAGHVDFVFGTAQAFLVMAFQSLADAVRDVCRYALYLSPPKPLDYGHW